MAGRRCFRCERDWVDRSGEAVNPGKKSFERCGTPPDVDPYGLEVDGGVSAWVTWRETP